MFITGAGCQSAVIHSGGRWERKRGKRDTRKRGTKTQGWRFNATPANAKPICMGGGGKRKTGKCGNDKVWKVRRNLTTMSFDQTKQFVAFRSLYSILDVHFSEYTLNVRDVLWSIWLFWHTRASVSADYLPWCPAQSLCLRRLCAAETTVFNMSRCPDVCPVPTWTRPQGGRVQRVNHMLRRKHDRDRSILYCLNFVLSSLILRTVVYSVTW